MPLHICPDQRMHTTRTERDVSCGLWVTMTVSMQFHGFYQMCHLVGTLTVGKTECVGHGVYENSLPLTLNFAVKLNCSKDIKS